MAKLTEKQQRFVDEYLIDLNATQAAIRAGYSEKTARKIGNENLTKLDIQKQLEKRMKEREKRTEITQDRVLKELAAIGFAKTSDYAKIIEKPAIFTTEEGQQIPLLDKDGTPLMIPDAKLELTENLTEEQVSTLAGIKHGKYGIEVAQCDKVRALELLGRHLGMFKDKVELVGLEEEKSKLDNVIQQMRGGDV